MHGKSIRDKSRKFVILKIIIIQIKSTYKSQHFISRAPTKIRLKIIISIVEKFLKILDHNNKVKNMGTCCDSTPYLVPQKPVVLPIVPWEPFEFLTNVSKTMKIYGTRDWNRSYWLRNFCPNLTAEIYVKIKNWQKYTVKKRPY